MQVLDPRRAYEAASQPKTAYRSDVTTLIASWAG
jgi:hypothetical protein